LTNRLLAPIGRLSDEWRNDMFWVLLLLGLVPALGAGLLFPTSWFGGLTTQYALPSVENPFGLVAILIALLIVGIALVSKQKLRILAAIPFVAVFLAGSFIGETLDGLSTVYVLSAFFVFVYFTFRGEALSLPFALFIVLLMTWQSYDDLLAWPHILVFVVAVLVARLVVEAVRQNLPLARDLGRSNLASLAGRTFSLWWPMLILIGIGMWASAKITGATEDLMYTRGYVTAYCALDANNSPSVLPCPDNELVLLETDFRREGAVEMWQEGDPLWCRLTGSQYGWDEGKRRPPRFHCPPNDGSGSWPVAQLGFFDSLDRTVEQRYDVLEVEMRARIRQLDQAAFNTRESARQHALDLFSIVPSSTGMEPSPCYDFPFVDCEAANIVITGLNSAYERGRGNTEMKFVNSVEEVATDASLTITQKTTAVGDALAEDLNNAETRTRQAIDRVHTAGNIIRQILLLWLIVIAIKSILYVFARVIFDKSTDIDVDLLERDGIPAEGKVRHMQEVSIPPDYSQNIFYKANYQPLGPAARFSIPQWRSSIMSRLRFGAWNMSKVVMPLDDDDGITFNSVEAEHLVDWELKEGEEVVFSYRNFVAMNDNIQLRTVISLRVATLLLGRIVFHTARCTGGPGRLILRTRGKPATADQVRRSIPAARLVAWNRYARFSVDSHLTRADIFLNGFNLRRSAADSEDGPQGILVVEADARDGGMLVGTLRFARNFLMPI